MGPKERRKYVIHIGFNCTVTADTPAEAIVAGAATLWAFEDKQVDNLKLHVNYEIIPIETATLKEERKDVKATEQIPGIRCVSESTDDASESSEQPRN